MPLDECYELVRQFHQACNVPLADRPTLMSSSRTRIRIAFLQEELSELNSALDIEDQADALIDIIYLALGGFVEMGVQPEKLFEIVHEANMRKAGSHISDKSERKVAKPVGWLDPKAEIGSEIRRQKK
jgi:predicted HAD superfamily Cof-like phosphohydrolase